MAGSCPWPPASLRTVNGNDRIAATGIADAGQGNFAIDTTTCQGRPAIFTPLSFRVLVVTDLHYQDVPFGDVQSWPGTLGEQQHGSHRVPAPVEAPRHCRPATSPSNPPPYTGAYYADVTAASLGMATRTSTFAANSKGTPCGRPATGNRSRLHTASRSRPARPARQFVISLLERPFRVVRQELSDTVRAYGQAEPPDSGNCRQPVIPSVANHMRTALPKLCHVMFDGHGIRRECFTGGTRPMGRLLGRVRRSSLPSTAAGVRTGPSGHRRPARCHDAGPAALRFAARIAHREDIPQSLLEVR